jgi:hypothetical protein
METNKPKSDSLWANFVDSFEDYMSTNPFVDIDEMYMTNKQRTEMYKDAATELKAKIQLIKKKKSKKKS